MTEAGLAQALNARAEAAGAGAPRVEERSVQRYQYIYLSRTDQPLTLLRMTKKQTAPPAAAWERQYRQLCASLADTGYISQGSVVDRSRLKSPRSGYQWTRKLARKTITVALSPEQFQALGQAIQNRRRLQKTITQMEKLSRQILFQTLPDTTRHKPLRKKNLGVI